MGKRRKRRNYIQRAQSRVLYIIMGVVACVVVGGIVLYTYVIPPRLEQEVVRPARQEMPASEAARERVQTEEPEGQLAELPAGQEGVGPPSAEEEQPATAVEISEPPEEAEEEGVVAVVEEEVVVATSETPGEPAMGEGEEVREEPVVEPEEEPPHSPVVEEEVVSAIDVEDEGAVVPMTIEEEIPAGEPIEELIAAAESAAADVEEAPEVVVSPEAEVSAELAALETPPPPEVTSIEPQELPYAVHVASYRSEERAIEDVTAWLQRGRHAFAVPATIPDKGLWYRVLVGRYATRKEASEQAAKLKVGEGLDYATPMTLPYVIEVSTFQTLTLAGFEEAKLQDSRYTPFIVPVPGKEEGSVRYKLFVGVFEEPDEAEAESRRLREEGIANTVIRP